MGKRAMLYCQHLAGIGHLVRSAELAQSMRADGWEVLLICGGKVPHDVVFPSAVDVELLEPIQSDPEYKTLFACAHGASLEDVKARRSLRLLALLDAYHPDLLITEMYPFGRKQFEYELLPLLQRAREASPRPLIVASVRDILVQKKDAAAHEQRVLDVVNKLYDAVLVHSDEAVQPLRATFARTMEILPPVVYTGYITASQSLEFAARDAYAYESLIPSINRDEPFILVSCGSGRLQAGQELVLAAIAAAPALAKICNHRILICAGPLAPKDKFLEYQWKAVGRQNVHLVHDLPHLQNLLRKASLSVSLGGYNTVMELLSARTQGLVYAAEPNGDNEQKLRVESLAGRGMLRQIVSTDLTGGRLAGIMAEALTYPHKTFNIQQNGAPESARVLSALLSKTRLAEPRTEMHRHSALMDINPGNQCDMESVRQFQCA